MKFKPSKPLSTKVPAKANGHDEPGNQVVVQERHFSGPLPHPEILRQYDELAPGLSERIVRMAEQEGEHRRELENEAVEIERVKVEYAWREVVVGQVFALVIALSGIIAGGIVAVKGQPAAGGLIGGLGIGGIVSAFILGRGRVEREKQEKAS